MLLWSTTAQLVGCVVLAFATTQLVVALAFTLIGINFALVNLGIGVGWVIGGLYTDVSDPTTFTVIFLADGASMLVPIALLLGPLRHLHGRVERAADAEESPGSYLAILGNPAVAWLTGLTFLATFVGYGQMEAGFPAFARGVSEVSTDVIGFAFAVNTAVIVGLQFVVLRLIGGHRRTRVLLVMTALWAASWGLLGLTGLVPGSAAAVAGVLGFHAVFALGETMLQPTIPAITNDLAPDHLRGRYNAVTAGAFQGGTIAGPVVAGILLDRGWDTGFVVALVAGCAVMTVLTLALERHIDTEVNGIGAAPAVPVPDVTAPAGPTPTAG